MYGRILFVDDEQLILDALKRAFNKDKFQCFFANNGKMALEILAERQIDVILADISMPEIDGLQLLKIVRDKYPEVIRIIISGFTDHAHIFDSVLDGTAKLYITKPWRNKQLKIQLESLLAVKKILQERNLFRIIDKIENLSSFPSLYNQIASQLEHGKSIEKIIKAIMKEPFYILKILRIANSISGDIKINSLRQAILNLGINNIKHIILSTELFISEPATKLKIYNSEVLWMHSLICNNFTIQLYKFIYKENIPENYAVAGLVHDLGKLIIKRFFPDKLQLISELLEKKQELHLFNAEKRILGFSHSEIAAYLFNWWNLSSILIEACLYHHTPMHENILNKKLLIVLYLADFFAWHRLHKTTPGTIDISILTYLGLNQEQLLDFYGQLLSPGFH